MNVKVFLAIAAAIAVVYGVAFVAVPDFVQATYGMTSTASSILAARYFGLTLLGLGLVTWLVRETSDPKALRGLLSGLAIQSLIGALVSIWGTTSGTMNGMGWSAVLIYAVLLAGYVYYLFADRTITGRA
jgi:uncharacterized protein YjeT (DUF2065 family)